MIYNIAWPIIEFFMWWSIRTMKRLWDKRWWTKFQNNQTHAKTADAYIELYAGPVYSIHYKYSFIMNIVWITFLFGAGMPILFPIATCSLIVLYYMERLLLAYSYRKPPMFDQTLNRLAIKLLLFAPLLYFSFGFWMYNNP